MAGWQHVPICCDVHTQVERDTQVILIVGLYVYQTSTSVPRLWVCEGFCNEHETAAPPFWMS